MSHLLAWELPTGEDDLLTVDSEALVRLNLLLEVGDLCLR